jgi:chromosome condensin MukBEF ATPase and DNA-binding subunit MukB
VKYIEQLEQHVEQLEEKQAQLEAELARREPSLENILRMAIDMKRKSIDKIVTNTTYSIDQNRVRELFTIRLNMGRREGHTTALKNIYTSDPENTLLCTAFPGMKRLIPGMKTFSEFQRINVVYKLYLLDNFLNTIDEDRVFQHLYSIIRNKHPIVVMT